MLTTFITTLKVLVRDRTVLLWAIAFPLVLATLFHVMFSTLDESYKLDPIPLVIVQDAHYSEAESFSELIDALAADDANDGSPLLLPTFVADEEAALGALKEGNYQGYIQLDADGTPSYHRDARRTDSLGAPNQSIISSLLDRYVQDVDLITRIAEENPQLLASPDFLEQLAEEAGGSYTQQVSVTANPPSDALRYYYAVLAFSTIMMATFALSAVDLVLGNTSPLGARRSLGGQSKLRTLVPTLSAAWLLSFACVMLGFLYLRFVFDVGFGGKEGAVVLTLLASSLCITFFGAFLGSLPLQGGIKGGLVAFFSCFLSLFAGLYGPSTQVLGDLVAQNLPWFSAANPVRQVSDALFSLYFYDGYEQLMQHLIGLLVIAVVFFIAATLNLRRQRYASL